MPEREEIEYLFQKYSDNRCTTEEIKQLLAYFKSDKNEDLLKELIEKHLGTDKDDYRDLYDGLMDDVSRKLAEEIARQEQFLPDGGRVMTMPGRVWYRVSAAAVIILLLSVSGYYYFAGTTTVPPVVQQSVKEPIVNDVAPGVENALLTLDNGAVINLDKVKNGQLVRVGNISITKEDGNITFKRTGDGQQDEKPVYSTVSTLRGNEYHLILEDGTGVWLNAESSLRFPVAFTGDERNVQVQGEAYFEVAKMAAKPFRVNVKSTSGNAQIEVLGTHFNVSAYPEDTEVKTTLLEGSVKIKKSNEEKILSPGEQARYAYGDIRVKKDVDVQEVMGWKEGLFIFNNTDIRTIMQEMARWYDVDVQFEGNIPPDGFTGKVAKSLPLSKFLEVLELNGIHLKMEGRKVIVLN